MDIAGLTNYAYLTAALATVGMLWGHAKSIFDRFRSFFVLSCTIEGDAASGFFLYCRTKLKSSRFDKRHYDANSMFVRPLKKYRQVGREEFGEFLTFLDGWKPIFVNYKRDGQKGNSMTISCLRGMFDIEKMIIEGLAMVDVTNADRVGNRYTINRHFGRIDYGKSEPDDTVEPHEGTGESPSRCLARGYRILGWNIDELGLDSDKKPFDALVFPKNILDFIEVAKHWLDSKDFLHGTPHPVAFGYCLLWSSRYG